METLLREVASNVGWAAALALAATLLAVACPRRPALAHGLWLLVLVKLVSPSLTHVAPTRAAGAVAISPAEPSIPAVAARDGDAPGPSSSVVTPEHSAPSIIAMSPEGPEPDRGGSRPWPTLIAICWLAGAAVWWSVVGRQVIRFRRLLRAARPAPDALCERVERRSAALGLRRRPDVRLVPARVPPMVWAWFGTPRLILPEALWDRLDATQQEAVLAHELAHLKRRDHWVRWFEALVLGLHWWNPLAWWARRRLAEAEEQCCDAWVAWALPEAADAYAEALVAAAAFLSGPRVPWPAGATGVGRVFPLRRRLNMILRDPATGTAARPASRAALIPGALALLLLPAWAPAHPPERERSTAAAEQEPKGDDTPAPAREVRGGPVPVEQGVAPGGVPKVKVSRPIVREVRAFEEFTGHVEAAQSIEIRARVGGTLDKVEVRPGQVVEPGSVLFRIDSRPCLAEWKKAGAEVSRAESRLKRAAAELQRLKSLQRRGAVGQEEVAQIEGNHEEAEASLQAAKAARDLAQLNLDFARVVAPIRGKVGRPRLAAGSLIVADTTVLGTIDSSDPMTVGFDVDERTLLRLGRAKEAGEAKFALEAGLPIRVALTDEDDFLRHGQVESVDARFDVATGTIRCRASLSNPDGVLLPGLFARVRLFTGATTKALLIPERAVMTPKQQPFVFVVRLGKGDEPNLVMRRPVKLGGHYDDLREVRGLNESTLVIVGGPGEVRDGMTVEPQVVEISTNWKARGGLGP